MATTSPQPNSSPPAVPPASNTSPPPPPPSTVVPPPQNSPQPPTPSPPQSNANPPGFSPPPTQSPFPNVSTVTSPTPSSPSPPPPVSPTSPPSNSSPPPPASPPSIPPPPPPVPQPSPGAPPTSPSTVSPPPPPPPAPIKKSSSPPPVPMPSPGTPPNSPPSSPSPPPRAPGAPPNSATPASPPSPSRTPKTSSPPPPVPQPSPGSPPNSPPSSLSPPPPTPRPAPTSPPPQSPPAGSPPKVPPAPVPGSPSDPSPPAPSSQPTPPSPPSPPPSITRPASPRVPVVNNSSSSSDSPAVNNPSSLAPESSNPSSNGGIGVGGVVAIFIAVGIIVLSLMGLAIWCLRKRKRKLANLNGGYVMPSPIGSSPRSDSFLIKTHSSAPPVGSSSGSDVTSTTEPGGLGNSRPWFTYEELVKATNGFSEQNLLGEGGFGAVYKGCLPDGREVAVKQLKIGGGQGEREFKAEVEIISRIHHRHLVSLVGYCISKSQRLLVYDYVPNDTLYFHLHGEGRPVLDWATRIKIAAGAARGIAYLHEDCHPRIIHRDIKSSNILLDNNFEARVSDFGLAKLALDANTHITTRVMGTFGYMAPEYATSGKLTEKSDVFSFGVVLLELITGRKPVDTSQPMGDESLVEWARPLLSHALDTEEYESLADPRLGGNYVNSEMFQMVGAAAACVRHLAARRPSMGQIVRAFDSFATVDLCNGMKVGESEVYNSAQQSQEIRWFQRMAFGSQSYNTEYFSESNEHDKF
ncbi:hypothetical protein SLA2020_450070 [Shorea laevis]